MVLKILLKNKIYLRTCREIYARWIYALCSCNKLLYVLRMKKLYQQLNSEGFTVQLRFNDTVIYVGSYTQITGIGIDVLADVFCIEVGATETDLIVYRPVCGGKPEETWLFNSRKEVIIFLNQQYEQNR